MGIFNKKIIIGIHGLANKPEKSLLKKWWIKSIREGFATIGKKGTPFTFKLVYWADLVHDIPQDPKVTDKKSPAHMKDPYVPGDPTVYSSFTPSNFKRKILDRLEKKLDKMFFDDQSFINYDKFAGLMMKSLFKDLDFYYHRECAVPRYRGQNARVAIRNIRRDANNELKAALKEKLVSEDQERRSQEQIQKLTDQYIHDVDKLLEEKEADLLAL